MLIPTKEMIQQSCKTFGESKVLKREARNLISKITFINEVFQEHFEKGHYEGSFIINDLYFRVLYFGSYDKIPLRVEECAPPNKRNKNVDQLFANSIYMPLSDFLWTFWPQGIYYIEKFLLEKE